MVEPPGSQPLRPDALRSLELCPQERSVQLAETVRGSDVDPGILVHLIPQEATPVRPFVTEDLGPLDELLRVDEKRTALSRRDVLRLVETHGRESAKAPCRRSAIGGPERLCCVLDHSDPVARGDRSDRIHLTGHSRVVHRHHSPRPRSDRGLDEVLVQVQGVTAYIHEDGRATAQDDGVRG